MPGGYEVTNRLMQFGFNAILDELGKVKFSEPRSIGEGVFMYKFASTDEGTDSTVWLSLFYGRLPFVGFVVKPKHLR